MISEDKLHDLLVRAAGAFDSPSMAEDVMARVQSAPAGRIAYRVNLRERIFLMTRAQKIAAAIVLAVLLAATGWAADKAVHRVIEGRPTQVKFKPDSRPATMTTVADGNGGVVSGVMGMSGTMTMVISTHKTVESEQFAEIDKLIGRQKYTLVGKRDTPMGLERRYRFVLSDGNAVERTFYLPLEQAKSFSDYGRKSQEYEKKRQEAMQAALVKGRYRLVNVELILSHVCVDEATGKKISVERIEMPDGEQLAEAREIPSQERSPGEEWEETHYEMSWQEHLDAIKAGRRRLLDAEAIKNFWYEMTLEDGSRTILGIGGQEPLPNAKTTSRP
jgi:hypothetical protein